MIIIDLERRQNMTIDYQSPQPGPNARKIIERDQKVMFGANTRTPEIPLVVDYAKGVIVHDVDGREYIDFGAGFAVCGTGHCHPDVVKVIKEQAEKLLHISGSDFYYLPQLELAEKLLPLTPGNFDKRVYFANSGVETLEAAIKISRNFTRRPKMIAFLGAFHGRTFAGMTLSGSKKVQKAHFAPLIPEVTHIPFAYCYRCPFNLKYPDCRRKETIDGIPLLPCIAFLTEVIFEQLVDPEDVAGIFVETIQGEGGYIVPPPEFHRLLRAITKKYEICYVLDEIQCGLGRTGKMFAIEHWGVEPDILCIAKAIASGLPLGAVIARAEMMDEKVDQRAWKKGSHGSTFGGNPVACAAGIKSIELIKNGLVDNAARVGKYMKERLMELAEKSRIIGDVRGLGLMIGIELVKDKRTKEKFPRSLTRDGKGLPQIFTGTCFKKGLILYSAGFNCLRISPPLILTKSEADQGLAIFEEALKEVEKLVF